MPLTVIYMITSMMFLIWWAFLWSTKDKFNITMKCIIIVIVCLGFLAVAIEGSP